MDDYDVLIQGNTLAVAWSRKILGKRKLGVFRDILANPKHPSAKQISQEKVEAIKAVPQEDRRNILATDNVAERIFLKFDRLALRIARKFAATIGRDNDADISQLESEARVGLLKAIRGYTRSSIKFITYAHRAITNEVSRYISDKMGLGLNGVNTSLLIRFKRKQEELSKASLPHNFEDVIAELGLTSEKEISRLRDALHSQVTSESEMEDDLASMLLDNRRSTAVDRELIEKLGKTSLPMLAKCAFFAQKELRGLFPEMHCDCCECREKREVDPDYKITFNSLKDVSDHFQVTPQAVSDALSRARKKLQSSLGKEWQ